MAKKKKSSMLGVGVIVLIVGALGAAIAGVFSNKKARKAVVKEVKKAEKKVTKAVKRKK